VSCDLGHQTLALGRVSGDVEQTVRGPEQIHFARVGAVNEGGIDKCGHLVELLPGAEGQLARQRTRHLDAHRMPGGAVDVGVVGVFLGHWNREALGVQCDLRVALFALENGSLETCTRENLIFTAVLRIILTHLCAQECA